MLLLSPGPGICDPEALSLMAEPIIHHRTVTFKKIYESIVTDMKTLLCAPNAEIILMNGSGSTGMEGAVQNLITSNDHVLSIRCGYFSDRFYQMASYQCPTMYTLHYANYETYQMEDVEWMLQQYPIHTILVTHCESETGVLQDISALGKLCEQYQALLIVDSISGVIMNAVHMEEDHIDCLIMASQKGFMLPPGLSITALSPKALLKMQNSHVKSYVFDYQMILKKYTDDQKIQTTPCIPLYRGLAYVLQKLIRYSPNEISRYYAEIHNYGTKQLQQLNFKILSQKHESNSLIVCKTPYGIRASQLQKKLEAKGIRIELGLRDREDRILRIGCMNHIHRSDFEQLIHCIRNILYET